MPRTVVLDPVQEASLDHPIAAGRYGPREEAVAAGVALLLRNEDRLTTRHEAWREGIESGDYEPLMRRRTRWRRVMARWTRLLREACGDFAADSGGPVRDW